MLEIKLHNSDARLFLCEGNRSNTNYDIIISKVSELYNLPISEIKIEKNSQGKPIVVDKKIFISCSYTQDYWAFIISNENIGLDIEKITVPNDLVIKKIFNDKEKKFISLGDINERFFMVWTMKESYSKWTGEGLSIIRKIDVFDEKIKRKLNVVRYKDIILSICKISQNI